MHSKGALKKLYLVIAIIVIVVAAAITAYSIIMPRPTPTIPFRIGTSTSGSMGYKMTLEMITVLKREMPKYDFLALVTAGYTASLKMYCSEEAEGALAFGFQAADMYTAGKTFGFFKGFEAKRLPSMLFAIVSLEYGIAIHQRDVGKIRSWSDLDGKPIFMYPPAWGARPIFENIIFPALGIKPKFIEVDFSMVGTALTKGDIVATGVYTSAGGMDVPPWIAEMVLTTPIAILNPSPEELAKLEAKGIKLYKVDLTKYKPFKIDVKADFMYSVPAITTLFTDDKILPEEDAYKFIKAIEKNINELKSIDPSFSQLADDFVGMQLLGIEFLRSYYPQAPIHPGLIRYLKEKGVWKGGSMEVWWNSKYNFNF
jgi:TRAP-type uncharacterized transport system substrate-binding protein